MSRILRDKSSSFHRQLGEELNLLWDALRSSQPIPSKSITTKQTSTGTVISSDKTSHDDPPEVEAQTQYFRIVPLALRTRAESLSKNPWFGLFPDVSVFFNEDNPLDINLLLPEGYKVPSPRLASTENNNALSTSMNTSWAGTYGTRDIDGVPSHAGRHQCKIKGSVWGNSFTRNTDKEIGDDLELKYWQMHEVAMLGYPCNQDGTIEYKDDFSDIQSKLVWIAPPPIDFSSIFPITDNNRPNGVPVDTTYHRWAEESGWGIPKYKYGNTIQECTRPNNAFVNHTQYNDGTVTDSLYYPCYNEIYGNSYTTYQIIEYINDQVDAGTLEWTEYVNTYGWQWVHHRDESGEQMKARVDERALTPIANYDTEINYLEGAATAPYIIKAIKLDTPIRFGSQNAKDEVIDCYWLDLNMRGYKWTTFNNYECVYTYSKARDHLADASDNWIGECTEALPNISQHRKIEAFNYAHRYKEQRWDTQPIFDYYKGKYGLVNRDNASNQMVRHAVEPDTNDTGYDEEGNMYETT